MAPSKGLWGNDTDNFIVLTFLVIIFYLCIKDVLISVFHSPIDLDLELWDD